MPNENCLLGKRCPSCGSEGPFKFEVTAWATVSDDGTDEFEDIEWDEDSGCARCLKCYHFATIGEFDDAES